MATSSINTLTWSDKAGLVAEPSWKQDTSLPKMRRGEQYQMPDLSAGQTYALHVASLTTASVSITAGALVLTWLFRMRRGFRHDLIMLLLCSDMFKACWVLVFPVVELVHGPIKTEDTFCQVSGFFLASSIEMSDLAVSMISIHTALYIFRGEQGLFPFRKYAYTFSTIASLAMASFAFIDRPGYVNTGQFCYLPFDPLWKRLALSWIPRYLSFATILLLCLAIYIYVRALVNRFESSSDDSYNTWSGLSDAGFVEQSQPKMTLLLPLGSSNIQEVSSLATCSAQRLHAGSLEAHSRKHSTTSINAPNIKASLMANASLVEEVHFQGDQNSTSVPNNLNQKEESLMHRHPDATTFKDDVGDVAFGQPITSSQCHPHKALGPLITSLSSPDDSSCRRNQPSNAPMTSSSNTPARQLHASTTANCPENVAHIPEFGIGLSKRDPSLAGVAKTREKISRQLRLLFIYPLVYVVVWILPFIVHLTGFGNGAPFGMRMASIISLSLQGFADALVFSLKEQPWRHARRFGVRGFSIWKQQTLTNVMGPNVGRTREEMMLDGRIARKRRDQELADRKLERMAKQGNKDRSGPTSEWWDDPC